MSRRTSHAVLAGLSVVMAVLVGLLINLVTDEPRLVVGVPLAVGTAAWAALEFARRWSESPPAGSQDASDTVAGPDPPDAADVSRDADAAPPTLTDVEPTAHQVDVREDQAPPRSSGVMLWRARADIDHTPDGYFGRERVTEKLARTLVGGTPRIVTLQGVGGVGKTTTAYEAVIQTERDGTFGRILWTKVRDDPWQSEGPVGRSWAYAAKDLASQLGVDLGDSTATWDSDLRDAIEDARHGSGVLTVLDNLEIDTDMRRFTERLHRLGFATAPHKLLVTSRAVAPLASIQPYQITGLDRYAAIDLIRHLGAHDERLFTAPAVKFDPILDAVDGNPLLIKIVVRRFISGSRSLEETVEELPHGKLSDDVTVADHLFGLALAELVSRAGREAMNGLMYAFSVVGRRGGEYTADQLREMSGLEGDQFSEVLDAGRDLGLIGGGRANEQYSIHSLLHDVIRRRLRET